MPCRASTSDRTCPSQPCARDPGTACIEAPGDGLSGDGTPNGLGDCAMPAAAHTRSDRATVIRTAPQAGRRTTFESLERFDIEADHILRAALSRWRKTFPDGAYSALVDGRERLEV